MQQLTRLDLMSLERYAEIRPEFRAKVMAHKKNRRVQIGEHAVLNFEDRLTIQYQIQEMLRIEKVFDKTGIQDELDAYNPLIPDGHNLKATFMFEYADIVERKKALATLVGAEDKIYIQIADFDKVYAMANEDLPRSTEDKTSAVHFLRFELTLDMIDEFRHNTSVSVGIMHQNLKDSVMLEDKVTSALAEDFC